MYIYSRQADAHVLVHRSGKRIAEIFLNAGEGLELLLSAIARDMMTNRRQWQMPSELHEHQPAKVN